MKCSVAFLLSFLLLALTGLAQDPNSQDAKERKKAAEQLSKDGASALPTLSKLTTDVDLDVRREAVRSVVQIGTTQSIDILLNSLRDNDPEVQMLATDGLVNFYLPGYVEGGWMASFRNFQRSIKGKFTDVNTAVIDPYIEVRPQVITEIGKLAYGGASIESRANANRALGILRAKAAVPDIVRAVRTVKEDSVLQEGLVALQKIRDTSAAKDVAFLVRDPKKRVQIRAIETMGVLAYQEALPDIENVFRTTKDKEVRRQALETMAMMPKEGNRDIFKMYLNEKDKELRAAAAEGLGRLGHSEDARLVESMYFAEKDRLPKLSQAFSLAKLGRTGLEAGNPLLVLIEGLDSSSFKDVSIPLLTELAREDSIRSQLNGYLVRGTKEQRIGLSQVLMRSGDEESMRQLEIVSRDSDPQVAAEALRALRTLRSR